jgi:peptidyl-prolyl cis-trans isomerase B (cyclophilin B)
MITFKTNFGDIKIELDFENAPKTAENFKQYVVDGFYDGTIFHRVIDGFMLQGGGFEPGMKQKATREQIENEADNGLKNDVGYLSMARTSDPHSASSQFFINVKNNDFLNHSGKTMQGWGYAVFAKVVDGMDVVNKIKAVKTTSAGGHQDVPAEDVIIEKAEWTA